MDHRSSKENMYSSHLVKQESRVISICSPRGGIGRTSLTVNLAVAFAKQGKKVAVIDGDLQFGDVAMYFNLKPNRTIYEWVKEAYGRSNFSIDQYMVKHDSGVYILAAPPRPEFFEVVEEVHIITAIEEARKIFDVILIDTSAYLSEIHLNLLEEADDLLLMTKNDLSALRINKLYLDTLESMNLKGKVKVVLNTSKESKKMQLEPEENRRNSRNQHPCNPTGANEHHGFIDCRRAAICDYAPPKCSEQVSLESIKQSRGKRREYSQKKKKRQDVNESIGGNGIVAF